MTVFSITSPRRTINHQELYNYLYGKKGERNRFAVGFIPEKTTGNPRPESLRICPHIMNLPSQITSVVLKIATFINPRHNITREELEVITLQEA